MPIESLLFIGFNGMVSALHRESGEIVWCNRNLQGKTVTLLLDGDRLMVSSSGYIYCLNPQTGKILWQNPMKGFSFPVSVAMVSVRSQANPGVVEQQAVGSSV